MIFFRKTVYHEFNDSYIDTPSIEVAKGVVGLQLVVEGLAVEVELTWSTSVTQSDRHISNAHGTVQKQFPKYI